MKKRRKKNCRLLTACGRTYTQNSTHIPKVHITRFQEKLTQLLHNDYDLVQFWLCFFFFSFCLVPHKIVHTENCCRNVPLVFTGTFSMIPLQVERKKKKLCAQCGSLIIEISRNCQMGKSKLQQ